MADLFFSRRDSIKALLAISTAGALAACTGQADKGNDTATAPDPAETKQFLNAKELAFFSAVAQTIIPATNTAGAIEAGVPATIQELFSEWATDNVRTYWRQGLAALDNHFMAVGGQDFVKQSPKQKEALLAKYDADVFREKIVEAEPVEVEPVGDTEQVTDGEAVDNSEQIRDNFYKDLKSTVASAYYMSEPGASEELAYEPVPGDWKGCVPLTEYPKTWAT
jgi:hypothetical protein